MLQNNNFVQILFRRDPTLRNRPCWSNESAGTRADRGKTNFSNTLSAGR
jgi:hypothetical protein